MKIDILKERNGHEIYINGNWIMWIHGSKKNAEKELKKFLKENNL